MNEMQEFSYVNLAVSQFIVIFIDARVDHRSSLLPANIWILPVLTNLLRCRLYSRMIALRA